MSRNRQYTWQTAEPALGDGRLSVLVWGSGQERGKTIRQPADTGTGIYNKLKRETAMSNKYTLDQTELDELAANCRALSEFIKDEEDDSRAAELREMYGTFVDILTGVHSGAPGMADTLKAINVRGQDNQALNDLHGAASALMVAIEGEWDRRKV
ncbi:hypothetical protein [Azotobacter beijerinckii]|nr:hypothetical protein [Azotobacter beijerinckii]